MSSKSTFLLLVLTWCLCERNLVRSQDWVLPLDEEEDGCRTPDGANGECISIRQCRPIVTFLQNTKRPISDYVRKRLQSYSCAPDGRVCCPSKPIVIEEPSNPTPTRPPNSGSIPVPPDVTRHRNFYLLPEDCGYLSINDKIVLGDNANLNQFPWMALLYYKTKRGAQSRCGGSIINDRYILTAAHCISDSLLFVRVGEYDLSSKIDCQKVLNGSTVCNPPVQDVTVERVIAHPGFNEVQNSDIALVRVAKMDLSKESARPVCLPTDEDTRNARYNNVVVTGWGNINSLGQTAKILQKVDLPVMNLQQCQRTYASLNRTINYKQICAGARDGKDSCSGDSGGPLQVASYLNDDTRYVQQGLVSFGPIDCGMEGVPGVYTKIPYYMDWILDNIRP